MCPYPLPFCIRFLLKSDTLVYLLGYYAFQLQVKNTKEIKVKQYVWDILLKNKDIL